MPASQQVNWSTDERADVSPPGPGGEALELLGCVNAAKEGNAAAFEQLYRAHVDSVHMYLWRLTRDRTLAQDLTSETFLRALRGIRSFTYKGKPFYAWLLTIARNLAFDHQRSWRHRNVVPLDTNSVASGCERAPDELVAQRELGRVLHECLSQLPPVQRRCLEMRFFAGLPVAETAALLGRSNGGTRAMQYRATRRLAELLHERGVQSWVPC